MVIRTLRAFLLAAAAWLALTATLPSAGAVPAGGDSAHAASHGDSACTGASRGDPAAGKKIFTVRCVVCHKADGGGGIKLTGNATPNWRDAKRMNDPRYNDDYLRDCITNGKLKSGMVAWGKTGTLKAPEIENLIAYIRTFRAKK